MRDDGILTFYSLKNTAQPGRMPVEKLVSVGNAYYSRRNVGVTRLYAAAGVNKSIDLLARCHNTATLPDGAAFVIPSDGKQYRIDFVQEIPELEAIDVTLMRLGENYDVASET